MSDRLLAVAAAGDIGAVRALFSFNHEQKTDLDVNFRDANGNTALHLVMQKIIASDASVNLSPYFEIAEFLIRKHSNVNAKNTHGSTPFLLATRAFANKIKVSADARQEKNLMLNMSEAGGDYQLADEKDATPEKIISEAKCAAEERNKIAENFRLNWFKAGNKLGQQHFPVKETLPMKELKSAIAGNQALREISLPVTHDYFVLLQTVCAHPHAEELKLDFAVLDKKMTKELSGLSTQFARNRVRKLTLNFADEKLDAKQINAMIGNISVSCLSNVSLKKLVFSSARATELEDKTVESLLTNFKTVETIEMLGQCHAPLSRWARGLRNNFALCEIKGDHLVQRSDEKNYSSSHFIQLFLSRNVKAREEARATAQAGNTLATNAILGYENAKSANLEVEKILNDLLPPEIPSIEAKDVVAHFKKILPRGLEAIFKVVGTGQSLSVFCNKHLHFISIYCDIINHLLLVLPRQSPWSRIFMGWLDSNECHFDGDLLNVHGVLSILDEKKTQAMQAASEQKLCLHYRKLLGDKIFSTYLASGSIDQDSTRYLLPLIVTAEKFNRFSSKIISLRGCLDKCKEGAEQKQETKQNYFVALDRISKKVKWSSEKLSLGLDLSDLVELAQIIFVNVELKKNIAHPSHEPLKWAFDSLRQKEFKEITSLFSCGKYQHLEPTLSNELFTERGFVLLHGHGQAAFIAYVRALLRDEQPDAKTMPIDGLSQYVYQAEPIDEKTDLVSKDLLIAADEGDARAARDTFLQKTKPNVNFQDGKGYTALHRVALRIFHADAKDDLASCFEIADLLLRKGADVNLADSDGNTPFTWITAATRNRNQNTENAITKCMLDFSAAGGDYKAVNHYGFSPEKLIAASSYDAQMKQSIINAFRVNWCARARRIKPSYFPEASETKALQAAIASNTQLQTFELDFDESPRALALLKTVSTHPTVAEMKLNITQIDEKRTAVPLINNLLNKLTLICGSNLSEQQANFAVCMMSGMFVRNNSLKELTLGSDARVTLDPAIRIILENMRFIERIRLQDTIFTNISVWSKWLASHTSLCEIISDNLIPDHRFILNTHLFSLFLHRNISTRDNAIAYARDANGLAVDAIFKSETDLIGKEAKAEIRTVMQDYLPAEIPEVDFAKEAQDKLRKLLPSGLENEFKFEIEENDVKRTGLEDKLFYYVRCDDETLLYGFDAAIDKVLIPSPERYLALFFIFLNKFSFNPMSLHAILSAKTDDELNRIKIAAERWLCEEYQKILSDREFRASLKECKQEENSYWLVSLVKTQRKFHTLYRFEADALAEYKKARSTMEFLSGTPKYFSEYRWPLLYTNWNEWFATEGRILTLQGLPKIAKTFLTDPDLKKNIDLPSHAALKQVIHKLKQNEFKEICSVMSNPSYQKLEPILSQELFSERGFVVLYGQGENEFIRHVERLSKAKQLDEKNRPAAAPMANRIFSPAPSAPAPATSAPAHDARKTIGKLS